MVSHRKLPYSNCSKTRLYSNKKLLLQVVRIEPFEPFFQIDKAQDQVQHAKGMLAQNACAAFNEQLSAARQQRDVEIGKLDTLLMARELIISATDQVKYAGVSSAY